MNAIRMLRLNGPTDKFSSCLSSRLRATCPASLPTAKGTGRTLFFLAADHDRS